MSLTEAATLFARAGVQFDVLGSAVVARAYQLVCAEAKRVMGTYDYAWPPLEPSTIERKLTGDSPLLETGTLRASVQWHAKGLRGEVGSNDPVAVWQELGTSHIPPRSFLAGAAMHIEDRIHRMAARAVVAYLSTGNLMGPELKELLEFLHHVWHAYKEVGEAFFFPEDEKGERNDRRH